jgi:hypothetical protein
MPQFFVAEPSIIKGAAQFFALKADGTAAPTAIRDANRAFDSQRPLKALPRGLHVQIENRDPKCNAFHDLGLVRHPDSLLVSARVKELFEQSSALKGSEAVPVELRDQKGKPVAGSFFCIRQVTKPPCIDPKKSVGDLRASGRGAYLSLQKVVLANSKIPAGMELLRPAQFTEMLLIGKHLVDKMIDAGFVGLDYTPVEKWSPYATECSGTIEGPQPTVKTAAKTKYQPASRRAPAALAAFVRAHKGKWLQLVAPCARLAFVFDWAALKADERTILDGGFLRGTQAEDGRFTPFAVLHTDWPTLVEELEGKPKGLSDLMSVQTDGLLLCDEQARIHLLDEGSLMQVARSPAEIRSKPFKP